MVYDCFLFFNELDILEIRLRLLYNYVDYFIISECDTTFSGIEKDFNFELNKDRFEEYSSKIIYIKHHNSGEIDNITNKYVGKKFDILESIKYSYNIIKNSPETDYGKSYWCRDFLQREYVMLGMDICEDDDIVIFSDLDELPDPNKLIFNGDSYTINQRNMIYYINRENITEKWYGSFITKYSNIKNSSVGKLRRCRVTDFSIIEDAGWHLTFMGGEERISEKIKSYGHQEYNNRHIHSNIIINLENGKDILNRGITITNVDMDTLYPEDMLSLIKEKYNYLIK